MHNAELEAELDSVRDEANSRISQLDAANKEHARLAQQHMSELQLRRKEVTELEAKLHSRSGVLADHSERAKQLQQVCCTSLTYQDDCYIFLVYKTLVMLPHGQCLIMVPTARNPLKAR